MATTITYPETLTVPSALWRQVRRDLSYSSIFGSQAVEISPPLWAVSLEANALKEKNSGAWKALLIGLKGKTNNLALWDMARPAPIGTMRGTMTLNTSAAQGATTLSIIAASEAAKTLLQGDLLGIGSGTTRQVVMVTADATANGSGIISVTVEPPLRNAGTAGASIVWDKPVALFRRKDSESQWKYSNGQMASGFSLDLIEDWR